VRIPRERVFTGTVARETFAELLLARWPDNSAAALNSVLKDLSPISRSGD
jgi:hypothetical protein